MKLILTNRPCFAWFVFLAFISRLARPHTLNQVSTHRLRPRLVPLLLTVSFRIRVPFVNFCQKAMLLIYLFEAVSWTYRSIDLEASCPHGNSVAYMWPWIANQQWCMLLGAELSIWSEIQSRWSSGVSEKFRTDRKKTLAEKLLFYHFPVINFTQFFNRVNMKHGRTKISTNIFSSKVWLFY